MGEAKWRREHGEAPRAKQTQEEFATYRDLMRRIAKNMSEREVGEAFMRGEAAKAAGIDFMFLHPVGAPPPPRADDDIWLSVRYEKLMFRARVPHRFFSQLPGIWSQFYADMRRHFRKFKFREPRTDARDCVFELLTQHRCWERGDLGALAAAAIAFLADSSPLGDGMRLGVEQKLYRGLHYEIAENPGASLSPEVMRTRPPGSRGVRNFRLMLMSGTDAELEEQRNTGSALPLPKSY